MSGGGGVGVSESREAGRLKADEGAWHTRVLRSTLSGFRISGTEDNSNFQSKAELGDMVSALPASVSMVADI